ncbi:MAG: hypothetical protein IPK19_14830 [Chloroflexi bacterium]|nr:hypothetical protein [Chloroflexota bacterium]
MRSLFIAQKRLLLMPALSLLLLFALVPVSAQTVDNFAIVYGDTVSDGVPGPGAGNIEVGGAQDAYTFTGTAGDEMILDVLAGSNGTFRWKIAAPDATILFDGLYVDRLVTLTQTGTHTITVSGFTGIERRRLFLSPPP